MLHRNLVAALKRLGCTEVDDPYCRNCWRVGRGAAGWTDSPPAFGPDKEARATVTEFRHVEEYVPTAPGGRSRSDWKFWTPPNRVLAVVANMLSFAARRGPWFLSLKPPLKCARNRPGLWLAVAGDARLVPLKPDELALLRSMFECGDDGPAWDWLEEHGHLWNG